MVLGVLMRYQFWMLLAWSQGVACTETWELQQSATTLAVYAIFSIHKIGFQLNMTYLPEQTVTSIRDLLYVGQCYR